MNTNTKNTITIDFSKLGGPVYIGRPKGKAAREKYKLDVVDRSNDLVKVIIPDNTFSINSSFFLGFFGNSIRHKKSKENFLAQFEFITKNKAVQDDINDFIGRALREKKPLI